MDVIVHPNPLLKSKCKDVSFDKDTTIPRLAQDMIKTMRDADGVGLAAIQVGILKRMLVFDDSPEQNNPRAIVNPVIVKTSESMEVGEEGCLSFPKVYFPVDRHSEIVVEAFDENGNPITIEAEGFGARVLQHEIDHLDGVMILDRAKPEVRLQAMRAYASLANEPEGTIITIKTEE